MGLLTDHNSKIQSIPDFGSMFNVVQHSIIVHMNAYEKLLGQKVNINRSRDFHLLHKDMTNALMDMRNEIIDQCFGRFIETARELAYPDSDFPYFKMVPDLFHLIGLSSALNDTVRKVMHAYTSGAWDGEYDFWMGCMWIGENDFTILVYPDKYGISSWFEIYAIVAWD